jgi:hypothetical protein
MTIMAKTTGISAIGMRNRIMNSGMKLSILSLLLALSAGMQAADIRVCQKISGASTETILPQESAPGDMFGRILGSFTGNFAGASHVAYTAILVSPPVFSAASPLASPTPIAVKEAFVTSPGDVITVTGTSFFNLAPSAQPGENTSGGANRCPGTPCVIQIPKTLKITGGTGKWTGATGQIRGLGLGNLNLPQGQGSFTFMIEGEVCLPAGVVGAAAASQDKQ